MRPARAAAPCAAVLLAATLLAAPAGAARRRHVEHKPPAPPILWLMPPPAPPPAPLLVIWAPPPNQQIEALPPAARTLIEQAIASGDQAKARTVIDVARGSYPQDAAQIDALSAENDARAAERAAAQARERADRLASASFLDLWKGSIEVGGSRSTGNADALALYGAVTLDREGLKWRQALTARADYQRTDGTTSVERITAAYQPQYKFSDRFYGYALAQYEHDRFLGFDDRYTAGPGIGYAVVARPRFKVDFEGGPAARYTAYRTREDDLAPRDDRTTVAGRASLGIDWKPSPTLEFRHHTALFLETGDSSVVATTSLDTKLIGPLKARFSYDVNYESDPGTEARNLDTVSRATLVYGF